MARATDDRDRPRLVGRDEERRAVRSAVFGGGCVVAGPAGVGKSSLAADAAATVGDAHTVQRVVATAAAASIPFGALSHLLPAGAAPSIAEFVAAFRTSSRPLLLVDDAHLLDDASAALLVAIANTGVASLLLTVRSGEPAPDALVALWKDRLVDRVDLQPLSAVEVDQLVDELLGEPSHTLTREWVYRFSEGNPLYVTELVADARRTGRIVLRDGRWCLADEPGLAEPAPYERLGDLLASHIRSVSDPARQALEVLAVGAPMRLGVFDALAADGALEELERARLAVVVRDGRGAVVELAHPLHGEVVRNDLPASATRRIRRDLAAVLVEHGADTPPERVEVARLLLESGQVDEARFLEASAIALRLGAAELAGELAAALPASLPAALALAQARGAAARFVEVDGVLAPFEDEAAAAGSDVAAAYVLLRVRNLLRGPEEQVARIRPAIARYSTWHDDADWRAVIAILSAWMALRSQAYREATAALAAPLADPDVSRARRLEMLLIELRTTARTARVDDYDAVMGEIAEIVDAMEDPPLETAMLTAWREGARISAARDLPGVRRRTEEQLAQASWRGDPYEYVALLYILAHVEHMQGHHAEALGLFQRSLDHLAVADSFNMAPITEVMRSITAAYLGDEKQARQALERADAAIVRMPYLGPAIAPDRARAVAMIELAAGREAAARALLLAVAADAGDDVVVMSESIHTAMLLGADPSACAAGLAELAVDAQDDVVHAWARHARAVADGDPVAQLAAAEAFEDLTLDLDAAQAAALAAVAFRQAGRTDSANRASTLAARCAARCPGVQMPALAVRPDAPDLTAREREIAVLAARGMSNPEIAAALVLSVRTVETYVLRVYRKLGVHHRTALAKALGHPVA